MLFRSLVAADDRVELALAGRGREVAAELVEDRRAGLLGVGVRPARGDRLLGLVAGEHLPFLSS